MEEKFEKYLPIGSVVLLKNATKKIMITGFVVKPNRDEKVYDYSGCLYPEGIFSPDEVALFDHNQIDKVFYIGYKSDEEKEFKEKLNALVNNINKES